MLAVAHGPLSRWSVDAVRPSALGLIAVLAATASVLAAPTRAHAADTRVYEQVTPVQKNGADIYNAQKATPDGNAVAFTSFGTFPGGGAALFQSSYVSFRDDDGWHTQGFTPISPLASPNVFSGWGMLEMSADLKTYYYDAVSSVPTGPDDQNGNDDLVAVSAGGTWTQLSKPIAAGPDTDAGSMVYSARSDDGHHVIFSSSRDLLGLGASGSLVYDSVDGHLTVASIDVDGTPLPNSLFGSGRAFGTSPPPEPTAISTDGSHIVFTAATQVYVRLGGTSTRLVSASQKTGSVGQPSPDPATFAGASRDGSRILLSTTAQLTDDAPAGGGLYAYDVPSNALTLVAAATDPRVVRVAPDGGRVYFLSTDQLVPGKGQLNGENLYVADDGTGVRFIALLDAQSANPLWANGEGLSSAVISPDGSRLAFSATTNLTAYDAQGKNEVYAYDDARHRISCPSCPSAGTAPTGEGWIQDPSLGFAGTLGAYLPRGFTTDNRLYFSSPEALVPADVNGVSDVYEADASGALRLISTGTDAAGAYYIDNTPDATSVFFHTRGALVSTDTDGGFIDIYDARVGGRAVPATPAPCDGETCKPPASAPPAAPAVASITAFDQGGVAPASATATTFTVSAISASARKRWAATGALTLKVHVSDAADLTATGRGTLGKKTATVASGTAFRPSAGTASLSVKLTAAARKALKRAGRLTVRLTVACSDTTRTSHATVVLRLSRKAGR